MNRGYAGYYKGFYLRSSYEYAYAVYLDYHQLPWSFEDQNYEIGGSFYKPDFFFYNKAGTLEKIVEVKSRNKNELLIAKKRLKLIEEQYQIETELISYDELLDMYKSMPVSLTSIISKWITSDNTTIHKSAVGKLNGHYGLRHSEEAKRRIGEHTRRLWNEESPAKRKMIEGLRKSGLSQKGKIKTPREKRYCDLCSNVFYDLITSRRIYCSRTCSGQAAIRYATEVYVKNRQEIHEEIKEFIILWTKENKELVQMTPFNKISSTIKPMTDEIFQRFGVKDFRVISKAVFGKDKGRKELLRFMKDLCSENVC